MRFYVDGPPNPGSATKNYKGDPLKIFCSSGRMSGIGGTSLVSPIKLRHWLQLKKMEGVKLFNEDHRWIQF